MRTRGRCDLMTSMLTKGNYFSKEIKSKSRPPTENDMKSESKKPSIQNPQGTVETEEIQESLSDLQNELLEDAHKDLVSEDSDDDVSSHRPFPLTELLEGFESEP